MNGASAIERLADTWRARAEELEPYAPAAARAFTRAADELHAALQEYQDEPLTLQQAAAEGGYDADSLARMLRDGRLENAGRKGAPRIRRRDVPRKPGTPAPDTRIPSGDPAAASPSLTPFTRKLIAAGGRR